jgi:hypothetical protein
MIDWARYKAAAAAVFLLGCSSSEPFDGSSVDLQGDWLLSDVTQPKGGTAPGGITNECRLTNVPITIGPSQDGNEWYAIQEPGGTFACEVNGDWSEPEAPPYQPSFLVTRTGSDVHWVALGRYSLYVGQLTSESQMSGDVDPSGYGRQGTWAARRR